MARLYYFRFLDLLKDCEAILEKIRNEREKLLKAELQERFGQPIEVNNSLLTECIEELRSFFNSIDRGERELISRIYIFILNKNARIMKYEKQEILLITAENEIKEWEAFTKNSTDSIPKPSNAIYYDKQLYQQLILRNVPNLNNDSSEWYLPIIVSTIQLPIPTKFAFDIFNRLYQNLIQFWKDLKVDFYYPSLLEWKVFISNPDHGVYLHIAEIEYDSHNLKIFGKTEDHEPYVVPNLIIKNYLNVQWSTEGKEVSLRFLIFDTSDKDFPFLNYLPYINVEAEPTVKNDLTEWIMNCNFYK